MIRKPLILLSIIVLLLVACGERAKPQIVSTTQPLTAEARLTFEALNAPPTAGPSPTPTPTSTPYLTPTPSYPESEPTTILAKVGNREITLGEYQTRVRYERWLPLYALARQLEIEGPQEILDLTLPENSRTLSLFYTLASIESMGTQTMNAILTEQIILQEAARLDLELDQIFFDARVAARIGVELGRGGARPSNWDEAYTKFIADLKLYTNMEESQFLEITRAITFYDQLSIRIGDQAPLPDQAITAVNVQDILLDSQEDALTARERLLEGESIGSIADSFGLRSTNNQTRRTIHRDEEGLPEEIIIAIFEAEASEIIGPFATDSGWYLARVLDTELDIPQPSDIEAIKKDYFRNWVLIKLDDPEYTSILIEDYLTYTPTDPFPQDVSPFMRDEFFKTPENPFADSDLPTPTPLPLGISPR